jgi:putative transposase
MRASLVNDALMMAVWCRKLKKGLLWLTDRGSQYASESHRDLLAEHHIIQSMSRKGNYWDNAVAESFFHSLKAELTHHHNDVTKDDARQAIFDYIEVFYNRQRLHSANDYLSPVGYEEVKQSVKKGVRDSVDTSISGAISSSTWLCANRGVIC